MSVVLISGLFTASATTAEDSKFKQGLEKTAESGAGYVRVAKPMETLSKMIGSALTLVFIGVTFLGLMLYAGYIWMMARGNEQEVAKAKNIIIYAVIGLVVILAAYAITLLAIPLWKQAITSTPE